MEQATGTMRQLVAILCVAFLVPGEALVLAQSAAPAAPKKEEAKPAGTTPAAAPAAEQATKLPAEQLDSLVAPVALYPDPLLAQTLVASTYPLEIVQLQQWLAKNKDLKDKALADAVAKQPWDPAIQSMAAIPDVVKRLSDDIQWTTDLGNAFLAQQNDVMDAVQRMRAKAKDKGALESNEHQKVETQKVEDKTVIIVQPTNPEVIYVPSYSPTVVYGAPMYPYPPIYYPYYPPGAAFVSFSFGVMWGAAIWGGSCCGCGWGGSSYVNVNVNNNFNRGGGVGGAGGVGGVGGVGGAGGVGGVGGVGGAGRPGGAQPKAGAGGGGGGAWQHNPSHRGGAPYGDKATANKYGGQARGDAPRASNRAGSSPSAGNRAGGAGGPSASNRAGGGAGSGDRVGNRSVPSSSASRNGGGFSGGNRGYSGSNASRSYSRGSSSYGGGRGGGGSRGGGGGGRRR